MQFSRMIDESNMGLQVVIDFVDTSMQQLSEQKRQAWGSLLSSLAASENIESLILQPLIQAYAKDLEIFNYLQAHGRDEVKHFQWLSQYVQQNTQYVRTGKSLSDQIFYEQLLPRLAKLAKHKSIYLFSLMYFYELFTLDFYKELMFRAKADLLANAESLFQKIRSDEIRHCQAAKDLIRASLKVTKVGRADLLAIQLLLRVFQLDMATFSWCVHNRRVRQSSMQLGISPTRMWAMSNQALQQTQLFLQQAVL